MPLLIKNDATDTVDVGVKQKRGEENREKERKKSQQNSSCYSFDSQLVHRWIGLKI